MMMDASTDQAKVYVPTWKDRLANLLFRRAIEDFEEDPMWAKGRLRTVVVTAIDWKDWLRILLGGKFIVEMKIHTDEPVVKAYSQVRGYVLAPWQNLKDL